MKSVLIIISASWNLWPWLDWTIVYKEFSLKFQVNQAILELIKASEVSINPNEWINLPKKKSGQYSTLKTKASLSSFDWIDIMTFSCSSGVIIQYYQSTTIPTYIK